MTREVRDWLRDHGAVFVRRNKHQIWRLRNGWQVTMPVTASDARAWRNALAFLKRTDARPPITQGNHGSTAP